MPPEEAGRSFEDWLQTIGAILALIGSVVVMLRALVSAVRNLRRPTVFAAGRIQPDVIGPNHAMPETQFKEWVSGRERWSQMRTQNYEHTFEVDISREVAVDAIVVISKGQRYPCKARLDWRRSKGHSWIEGPEQEWTEVTAFKLSEPRKMGSFRFFLTGPRLEPKSPASGNPPAWGIYGLAVRYKRFRQGFLSVGGVEMPENKRSKKLTKAHFESLLKKAAQPIKKPSQSDGKGSGSALG